MEELKVIDQTAITLCRENSLPLIVLNIHRPGAIVAAVRGERVGTLVDEHDSTNSERRPHAMDKDIAHVKTRVLLGPLGKASPNMLDTCGRDVRQQMQLNQVATVNAPEPRVLIVTPFDKGRSRSSRRRFANPARLEPSARARIIRVPLPADERAAPQRARESSSTNTPKREEVAVRHARTHGREALKKLNGVSEDDVNTPRRDLQKVHDDFIHKIDELIKAKEPRSWKCELRAHEENPVRGDRGSRSRSPFGVRRLAARRPDCGRVRDRRLGASFASRAHPEPRRSTTSASPRRASRAHRSFRVPRPVQAGAPWSDVDRRGVHTFSARRRHLGARRHGKAVVVGRDHGVRRRLHGRHAELRLCAPLPSVWFCAGHADVRH
jgi:ribosome recycling factor